VTPSSNLGLRHWLQQRLQHWQQFSQEIKQLSPQQVEQLPQALIAVKRDWLLAQRLLPNSPASQYLQNLYSQLDQLVYQTPPWHWRKLISLYSQQVPQLLQKLRPTLTVISLIFVISLISAWLLISAQPDLVALFASEAMIEQVQAGKLWTESLLNIMPSSILALEIMGNNIVVSLFAFMLGAFYGIGTLYIIVLNGLMLGAVFAYTRLYGLDGQLFEFVIAHGLVELSVILIAGAAGVQLGEALVHPGQSSRVQAFQQAIRDAGVLLLACLPFLIGAGIIEGYISPNPAYGLPFRILVGLSYGLLFWGLLFRPLKPVDLQI